MTLSEKAAYLKGLMDGLKLDTEEPEGKMTAAIVDMLGDVARTISEMKEDASNVSDELDLIEEELDTLGEIVFDDEEDDGDNEDYDDEYDYDDALYEIKCPRCGEVVMIDEVQLEEGSMLCPTCGEVLEFDVDDEEDDEEPEGDNKS